MALFNRYFILLILLFPFIYGHAQGVVNPEEFRFRHITTNDGLNSNHVKQIVQDKNGYMWFGGDGLYRYDGHQVKAYISSPEDNSIPFDNHINGLYTDSRNNLWVASRNGLYLYLRDTDEFRQMHFDHFITDHSKLFFFEYRDRLFVIIDEIYYIPLSDKEMLLHQYPLKTSHIINFSTFDKKNGTLIYVDQNNLIHAYNFSRQKLINLSDSSVFQKNIKNDKITGLYNNENYLVITYKNEGFHLVNKQSKKWDHFSFQPNDKGLNNQAIKEVFFYEDKIWIGTGGGGINIFDTTTRQFSYKVNNPHDPSSLSNNIVLDIYKSKNDIIWIGTLNGGINYFSDYHAQFHHISNNERLKNLKLSDNVVNTILEDQKGNLWVGTDKGGVNVLKKGENKFTKYIHDPHNRYSISSNSILSIVEDHDGIIWIGTWGGGLNRFNDKNGTFTSYKYQKNNPEGLAWNNVWALHVDPKNNLWIGYNANPNAGLSIFNKDDESFIHFKNDPGNPGSLIMNSVETITSDKEGTIWIGTTGGGLEKFVWQDSTFIHYKQSLFANNALSHEYVRAIHSGDDNILWIGTLGGGLNKFDYRLNKFDWITIDDGLPSNNVSSILEDNQGNLWMGTSKGLTKYNITSGKITTYNPGTDYKINQFLWGAEKTNSGMMHFGSLNGLISFYPDSIKQNKKTPPVKIIDFFLFGQKVSIYDEDSPLNKQISETDTIILNHNQRIFSFEFVALDYSASSEIQYAYKMEGLEDNWNYVGDIRYATYTNLDPGKYTFRVKASNREGVWNDKGSDILVMILPPWWMTTWFKLLFISALLATFFIYNRMRLSAYKTREAELENKVNERTSQLRKVLVDLKSKNEKIEKQKISIEEKVILLERQKQEILSQKDKVTEISKKLHENDQMKLRFFTSISHEIRTPLTLIMGPIESLIKNIKEESAQEKLRVVRKNSGRLLGLINQLMDFRKLEANKLHLNPVYGDIVRFIKNVCHTFDLIAEDYKISYTITSNTDKIICPFDPDFIEKILYNLLSNAFKCTPYKGSIAVELNITFNKNNPAEIIIKVKDNGKGIEKEKLPNLFSRFYQAENNPVHHGTGIGLAYVKSLIDVYKGEIKVNSEINKGAEFTVKLPLSVLKYGTRTKIDVNNYPLKLTNAYFSKEPPAKKKEVLYNKQKETILIVEDHKDLREYIYKELADYYNILEAIDGEQGINMAKQAVPGLIISDFLMPQKTGVELCNELKSSLVTCHIPIVMLTAVTAKEKRFESLEKGADAYITKPFDADELKLTIQSLLKSRRLIKEKFSKELLMQPEEIKVRSMDDEFILKIVQTVERNMANSEFSVEQLSSELSMSNSQLYLKMTAIINLSPLDFIRKIRLKRAAQLLKSGEYRISEVAFMVGFQDSKYFSKIFKKEYKILPSEYAKA